MFDSFLHRWLRIPYTLNVRHIRRPKNAVATIVFIHGIGNSGDAWNDVIEKLPESVRIIAVDLLGFGDSPKPEWALYNAKTQAKSVLATIFRHRVTSSVIIVGHSLGSLVAIEMAKRYPLIIKQLILCSPPLYSEERNSIINTDEILRQIYKTAEKNPETFVQMAKIAMKYNLVNKSFNVTAENVDSYMSTLSAMIINQTSLQDAYNLTVPTTIIHGTLDPFVVSKNLTNLKKANPNITVKNIIAGHEIRGMYIKPVVSVITHAVQTMSK